MPEPIPKPETVVQKLQKEKWQVKRAELEEERRLSKIPVCKKCGFRCSVCKTNKKCCFDQPENKTPALPIISEEKQKPPPWEQGYAVGGTRGTGPDESEAWED